MPDQALAIRRKPDALAGAYEQRCAHAGFQLLDGLAERGLRDVKQA
jgi:nitrite reductase/ring-hydroxylating ferredoxin subunit